MANNIQKIEPPALPLAPGMYDQGYQDQSNNVLRLFFNRLISMLRNVLSTDDGGKFLYFPRGSFYSTTNQTAAATSTGYPVEFENTYLGNGVSIEGVDATRLTVSADGVYNFQVTLGIQHTNASDANCVDCGSTKTALTYLMAGRNNHLRVTKIKHCLLEL
jgi:hypothetical protein